MCIPASRENDYNETDIRSVNQIYIVRNALRNTYQKREEMQWHYNACSTLKNILILGSRPWILPASHSIMYDRHISGLEIQQINQLV